MNLVFKKRIAISLAFALLCTSATPVKTTDNNNTGNTLLICSAIAAGIVSICGIIYGIVQPYKKSPSDIAMGAQQALNFAHMVDRDFYDEYAHTFEQACFSNDLNYVERYFLEAVMRRAQKPEVHIDIEAYINAVSYAIDSLEEALKEVTACIEDLKLRKNTDLPIYDHLVTIMDKCKTELVYLKAYYQRFAEHRAYFALAACEAKLLEKYKNVLLLIYVDSNESPLLYIAKMHNTQNAYPLVQYYLQLCHDIATLDYCIRSLTHQYSKINAAKKLWHQFSIIRDIIADAPAFKEEYKRKKEDDAHSEMLERTRKALQKSMDDQHKAIIAQQHAHRNKTTITSQPSARTQNGNANTDTQITIGSGNNQRTVSAEWYEQNKPGAVDTYIE